MVLITFITYTNLEIIWRKKGRLVLINFAAPLKLFIAQQRLTFLALEKNETKRHRTGKVLMEVFQREVLNMGTAVKTARCFR